MGYGDLGTNNGCKATDKLLAILTLASADECCHHREEFKHGENNIAGTYTS